MSFGQILSANFPHTGTACLKTFTGTPSCAIKHHEGKLKACRNRDTGLSSGLAKGEQCR